MAPGSAPLHFIRLQDLSDQQVEDILDLALRLKRGVTRTELVGRSLGLLFFRGSLRTRTSLEVATYQLGGHTVNMNAATDFWELESRHGRVMDGTSPEHIKDAAAVLSTYLDALAIRPTLAGNSWEIDRQDTSINAWAEHARVPVINMESALWHPLQALADLFTLRESLGQLKSKRLAIHWTQSPTPSSPAVVHSILLAALRSGMDVSVAHPPGFELDDGVISEAAATARASGAQLDLGCTSEEAAKDAHVIYARSWWSLESYGNPTLAASRLARGAGWCVDEKLLALGDEARVMHPMPVRRNLEVTDQVMDGPRSLMIQQAANRMYTQKGLLSLLLRG
ncbi:MAG: N-acetylornithine carbamoyltransferase [Planctomycetota bacterium]|jgi:N-acetylornithine carbamoyltransferase